MKSKTSIIIGLHWSGISVEKTSCCYNKLDTLLFSELHTLQIVLFVYLFVFYFIFSLITVLHMLSGN